MDHTAVLCHNISTMNSILFRFYAELNDFLPHRKRQRAYPHPFNPPVSVKHLIEAEGVPHPEVALIVVNGRSVDFSYQVQPDDRIAVYPAFASIDVTAEVQLRPPLPQPPNFLLDNHLGRLARYLRLLGFDVGYPNDHLSDEQLAQLAHDQGRVMLTRDRGLLMRRLISHGYCLRSLDSQAQLHEVLHRFNLHELVQPWSRCLRCNGRLHPVDKMAIIDQLQPKTKRYFDDFKRCADCQQIYWRGSHFAALAQIVEEVTA
jgi:uncharacterized protein